METPQRFWQGMPKAATISLLDKMLIGINADGSTKYGDVNQIVGLISAIASTGFKGVALTTTNPGVPTSPQFWLAGASGVFTNFGNTSVDLSTGIVILSGEAGVWTKVTIPVSLNGYATISSIVNNLTAGGTTVPLSAEQGKVLKTLVDASSPSNETKLVQGTGAILDDSWIASDGTILAFTGTSVIGPISVIEGSTIIIRSKGFAVNTSYIGFYGENNSFIERRALPLTFTETTMVVPALCKTARICCDSTRKNDVVLISVVNSVNAVLNGLGAVKRLSGLGELMVATGDNLIKNYPIEVTPTIYLNSLGNETAYSSDAYNLTNNISVKGNQSYRINKATASAYLSYYNKTGSKIGTAGPITDNFTFTTPADCYSIRFSVLKVNLSIVTLVNMGAAYFINTTTSNTTEAFNKAIQFDSSDMGALPFQPFINNGYNHIQFYGQSLSVGAVSYQPISTVALPDCFMIGANTDVVTGAFTPLVGAVSTITAGAGEQPVVGAINSLKTKLNRTFLKDAKFIGSNSGVGAKSIEELSKDYNSSSPSNIYNSRLLVAHQTAKTNAGVTPIVCPAIVYMQGEHNQMGTGGTNDKNTYKALLSVLKDNMQNDIMTIYAQTLKPLFFIYQTSVLYTAGNIPITQAQYEFAQENEDVILLNPHYYLPTAQAGGGHLNANGYRWFGEQTSKALYNTIFKNRKFTPILPKKFTLEETTLYIDFHVPVPPLVLDTKMLPAQTGSGFVVLKNNNSIPISSVEIVGSTCIKLTLTSNIATGTIDVSYGGHPQQGKGNVRDSDAEYSFAKYVDDTTLTSNNPPYTALDQNGINFYGKRYPLYNWLSNFYMNVRA